MSYHKISSNIINNSSDPMNMNTIPPTQDNTEKPSTLIDYEQKVIEGKFNKVLYRQNITNKLLTTLTTHNHPNALLIGEAGVGKTAIIEDLAVRLHQKDPVVTKMLGKETKIYELPLNNLVSGSSVFGQLEKKLELTLDFLKNPKNHAIVYIDEIHQLMTNQSLKNVSEILKPALSRNELHVIGSTTTQELKFWQENPAMSRRFAQINVPELNNEQSLTILEKIVPKLQNKNMHTQIELNDLKTAIAMGNKLARTLNTHRPDSAITVLDQAISLSNLQILKLKEKTGMQVQSKLSKKTIEQAGNQLINKSNVTLSNTAIQNLKNNLNTDIINQSKAKDTIIKALTSINLHLFNQQKPNSFLFLGPTGTGKTAIAKELAKSIFGNEKNMISLNMTEYSSNASTTSLIGSSRGFVGSDSAQPLPLDSLKTNAFQLILLDEFEKCATNVKRLFMKALDEGTLQYADGSKIDLSHAIIIATTNAGSYELNKKSVGFGQSKQNSNTDVNNALLKEFAPEIINRFEYVIPFNSINKEDYQEVLSVKYNKLKNEINETHPELTLTPTVANKDMNFIQNLANKSYDKMKNARPAERIMKQFIEKTILANPNQNQYNFEKLNS